MNNERIDVLAVIARKRAPFRDLGMRRAYEGCVSAYREKGSAYMAEGNSAAAMFRRGFTGEHAGNWDAASRKTLAYAQFRAGQDCAQDDARAAVTALMAEFDKAARALQQIAALGFDSTDEEVAAEALRIARLWRADDGHDEPLRNARAALARVGGIA